jgi:UDP-N-acetylmuramate dehydrogenase
MKQTETNIKKKYTPSLIQTNIPLKDKNWFATGGNASFFVSPKNNEQFQEALLYAQQHKLPITLLGQGANVLISDAGIDGLVIQPQLKNITIHENGYVTAGAGVVMQDLIDHCLNNNIIGLEEFSGIPGTVGGSVFINLHYFSFLLSQFLVSAHVIHKHTGEIIEVTNDWFQFGYNDSKLHHEPYYLVDATFALTLTNEIQTAFAKGRSQEIIRHRTARYPNKNTCGSFFRNFHPDEVTIESNGKKMIYVAYYLDKIGVKGALRVGDATVSWQHANMLVNCGNATTGDIIQLARKMQLLVKEHFNIIPQPECRLLGFDEHPLL